MTDIPCFLESLSTLVPLNACEQPNEKSIVRRLVDSNPFLKGTLCEALLWLRIGSIERPHQIVQDGSSPIEKYVHGIVHRMEADYWNSKYWFGQVKDGELLTRIGSAIATSLSNFDPDGRWMSRKLFAADGQFDPCHFVDLQEASHHSVSANVAEFLQRVGHAEWQTLWDNFGECG